MIVIFMGHLLLSVFIESQVATVFSENCEQGMMAGCDAANVFHSSAISGIHEDAV